MIRKTLPHTKKCTFAVIIPSSEPKFKGLPSPAGTGFFISSDGYFITAYHVVKEIYESKIKGKTQLEQPEYGMSQISDIKIEKVWPQFDIALLKADLNKCSDKELLRHASEFYYLEIDFSVPEEGTPTYSFGYPLPKIEVRGDEKFMVAFQSSCPRATSLIISSHKNLIGPFYSKKKIFPKFYVIDKALNYGNSGGPIVLQESGKVISLCIEFQPVSIPQETDSRIIIPSLYGISSSLKNIEQELKDVIRT